jgi:hypothetical protein
MYVSFLTSSILFVFSLAKRICDYVKQAVGEDMESTTRLEYMTYNRLLSECEKELAILREFNPNKRIDFSRFKDEIYKDCKLDPLVAWTQIRSFIKSSIEAVTTGHPLTREEYLNLGVKQCRLAPAQRELAYDAFEAYQKNTGHLWDDTVSVIVRSFSSIRTKANSPFVVCAIIGSRSSHLTSSPKE